MNSFSVTSLAVLMTPFLTAEVCKDEQIDIPSTRNEVSKRIAEGKQRQKVYYD